MENIFQSANDFNDRINLGIFSNLEKSYNSETLQKEFGDHQVIEKSVIDGFIQEVYRQTGGQIVKGKFNDTREVDEIIKSAENQLLELVKVPYKDENGIREVFILKSKGIDKLSDTFEKSKSNEFIGNANPFTQNLEKGKIADAFRYSNNLTFKKTGKEISEKMSAQSAIITANIARLETEIADKFIEGTPPTEKMYQYGISSSILCPYLLYHYCLVDHWENRNINESYTTQLGTQLYPNSSSEECAPYLEYNRLVEKWFEEQCELQMIRLYESNFNDTDKYELSAEQMISLGF